MARLDRGLSDRSKKAAGRDDPCTIDASLGMGDSGDMTDLAMPDDSRRSRRGVAELTSAIVVSAS